MGHGPSTLPCSITPLGMNPGFKDGTPTAPHTAGPLALTWRASRAGAPVAVPQSPPTSWNKPGPPTLGSVL